MSLLVRRVLPKGQRFSLRFKYLLAVLFGLFASTLIALRALSPPAFVEVAVGSDGEVDFPVEWTADRRQLHKGSAVNGLCEQFPLCTGV